MESRILAQYYIYIQFGGKNEKIWNTFQHNGVYFPPEYKPHNIPIIYEGEKIYLTKLTEEYATIYCKYLNSDYIKIKNFNVNFWKDWKKTFTNNLKIDSLEKCNFSLIEQYLNNEKEKKLLLSKEEKEKIKLENDKIEEKYKIAFVDGKEQPVGNYKIEPPGIFLGRGKHPKLGSIKHRIYPEDITLNIDKNSEIPQIQESLKDHKWKKIIHDNTLEWIASWQDTITKKIKYVRLGNKSDFQANSDQYKFDIAKKLRKKIKKIRNINNLNLISENLKNRQLAIALYFIDKLALRVGNEKGKDEADTVGVTSLRIEHIKLLGLRQIELDFLGKDSIRYKKKIKIKTEIYNLLKELIDKSSNKKDQLFDLITSADVNKYLQTFMKKLTAKVFRTYNASKLYQDEINIINKTYEKYNKTDRIDLLLSKHNEANLKVAILCNHQKNVKPKTIKSTNIKNMELKIKEYKNTIKKLNLDKKKNKNKILKLKNIIKKYNYKTTLTKKIKNLSLTTSRTNYIDPRITIAFLKKNNIPVEKIFSKSLQNKFHWAFIVDENYQF